MLLTSDIYLLTKKWPNTPREHSKLTQENSGRRKKLKLAYVHASNSIIPLGAQRLHQYILGNLEISVEKFR